MRTSDKGLLEIAEHEGLVPAPYWDSKRVMTFGIGHTAGSGNPPDPMEMNSAMPKTETELKAKIMRAIEIFRIDIRNCENRVNTAIKVPLMQHEFDALVSFDFNTGGIFKARLTKAINAEDPNAARHFMGWLKPPEIRIRRTAEMELFKSGNYDANGDRIPIYKTDDRCNLDGILKTISGSELLAYMGRPAPVDHVPANPEPSFWQQFKRFLEKIKEHFQ